MYVSKENVMNTWLGLTHPYGRHYKPESRTLYLVGRRVSSLQGQAVCNSNKNQQRDVSCVQKVLAAQCNWQLVQNCSKASGWCFRSGLKSQRRVLSTRGVHAIRMITEINSDYFPLYC
jgi:hypothetical protein